MLLGVWGSVSPVVAEPASSPLPSPVLGPQSLESFLPDPSPVAPPTQVSYYQLNLQKSENPKILAITNANKLAHIRILMLTHVRHLSPNVSPRFKLS